MNNQLVEDAQELRDENKELADLETENTVTYRTKLEKIAANGTIFCESRCNIGN